MLAIAEHEIRVLAPAPPLRDDATRHIAHGLEAAPREVAMAGHAQRHDHMPEHADDITQWPRQVRAVAAATGQGGHVVDARVLRHQAIQDAAHAVAKPADGQIGMALRHRVHHGRRIVQSPVAQLGAVAPQLGRGRAPHAAPVEGVDHAPLLNQPGGIALVERLGHAQRRGNDHGAAHRHAMGPEMLRGQGLAVVGGDAQGFHSLVWPSLGIGVAGRCHRDGWTACPLLASSR